MELDTTFYIQVALVLSTAAVIQGAAGFAFGLFATPMLLVVVGVMPEHAIALVAASATTQALIGVWSLRDAVQWRLLLPVLPMAVLTVPVGVWLLGQVSALEPGLVRQVFGVIVLVVLMSQWLWRVKPRDQVPLGWGLLAMAGAGLGTGLAGMASPATVPWVTAHRWSSASIRATMWAVFIAVTPPNMIFLYLRFGPEVGASLWQGGVFMPVVVAATVPGLWLGNRLGSGTVRRLAIALLLMVAAYSIMQPMLWPGLG